MDPLSITAGILAIFGAGGKVGNGLKKLVQLKDAPDVLLALCNEVTDLQCVVQDTEDLLQQWGEVNALPSSIKGALNQAKATVLDLGKIIFYDLTTITGRGEYRVDRSSWLRAETKVAAIKERIQAASLSLVNALSLLNASSMCKTNVQVQKVYLAIEGLQHQTKTVISPLPGRLDCMEQSLAQSLLEPNMISQSRTLESNLEQALVRGTVNTVHDASTVGSSAFGQTSKQE